MWATTKYVSVSCQSTGKTARITPDTPPITNSPMKPQAKYIGGLNTSEPRHIVASQLKILMPVGTAIANDESMKNASTTIGVGVANMWCAHTSMPRNAMAAVDAAIALYPKIGFRENTGMISEIIPNT